MELEEGVGADDVQEPVYGGRGRGDPEVGLVVDGQDEPEEGGVGERDAASVQDDGAVSGRCGFDLAGQGPEGVQVQVSPGGEHRYRPRAWDVRVRHGESISKALQGGGAGEAADRGPPDHGTGLTLAGLLVYWIQHLLERPYPARSSRDSYRSTLAGTPRINSRAFRNSISDSVPTRPPWLSSPSSSRARDNEAAETSRKTFKAGTRLGTEPTNRSLTDP